MKKAMILFLMYMSCIYCFEPIILEVVPSQKKFTQSQLITVINNYAKKLGYLIDERWLQNADTIEKIALTSIPMRHAQRRTSGSDITDDLLGKFKTGAPISTVQIELLRASLVSLQTYYKEKNKKMWQPIIVTHSLTTLTFKHANAEITPINTILI